MENSRTTAGKLTRQRSRLQMHAPSSIQVESPGPASVAEWKVAIPLLSPLDIVSVPTRWDPTAENNEKATEHEEEQERRATKWATWQHTAAPFYYEPVTGNGPAFLLPHCA